MRHIRTATEVPKNRDSCADEVLRRHGICPLRLQRGKGDRSMKDRAVHQAARTGDAKDRLGLPQGLVSERAGSSSRQGLATISNGAFGPFMYAQNQKTAFFLLAESIHLGLGWLLAVCL